ncbi:MAG: peptidase T [Lachnospiraceae bacterium]|nr:peptidase T [Lachnospiraceae bacterium]
MSKVVDNFLKYVAYDTQSAEDAGKVPSTEKQLALSKFLVEELKRIGVSEVSMSEHGYVYGTIPANSDIPCKTVGFLAHMDTSPDISGANVRPQLITHYNGGEIVLNKNAGIKMDPSMFPDLLKYEGQDLITTDGTTLLGADDKAGIAEIITMAEYLLSHPELVHGTIKLAFTPDEEVGHGVDFFDVEGWGADAAYTVDGGAWGEMEYETFNAASLKVTVHGRNIHPGSAKGKMKNSIQIAMEFERLLPQAEKPQYTEGYEGFFHLNGVQGNVEETVLHYIVRDHDKELFEGRKAFAERIAEFLNKKYGAGTVETTLTDSYYNMAEKIRPHWYLIDTAKAAFAKLGVSEPVIKPVRGGTDGSRLSYMGLPCPNLCTGGHNYHGKYEFICIQSMEKTVELLIQIAVAFLEIPKEH